MTESQQRDALAEAFPSLIWFNEGINRWQYRDRERWMACEDNDPLRDLNAMHEAVAALSDKDYYVFLNWLDEIGCKSFRSRTEASASQRAEALLHTLGIWKD